MSNKKVESAPLRDMFTDAAKEVIERARIKAQMNKILEIVEADSARLRKAYSEIGKMYCEGTLEENASRVEVLTGLVNHLNERIKRAKARYDELEKVHSVDECTQAFKSELQVKLKKTAEDTADFAKDFTEKAKVKAQEISAKNKAKSKKSDKAELSTEQNKKLLSLIKEQLDDSEEAEETAETTVEKIQSLLDSLSAEDEMDEIVAAAGEETPAEVTELVETITIEAVEEITAETENPTESTEVAEDFTF